MTTFLKLKPSFQDKRRQTLCNPDAISPLTLQQYPQFKITETITQSSHIFSNEDEETRFTQSSISSQSFYNFIHSTVPKQHDTKHYKFKVPFLLVHTTNESKSLKKNTPVTM